MVTIEMKVEKKLDLPELNSEQFDCLGVGTLECTNIECENCLFDIRNYKALLEQQKGGDD